MTRIKDIIFLILLITPFSIYLLPLNQPSFYPMAIGNEWEFNSGFDPHSDIIGDTIQVNGKVYYGFGRSTEILENWLREENQIVYCFNTTDSTEFVLYNFTMDIGDSTVLPAGYECSFGTKIFLISKSDTIVTPIGTFYNCYHFKHIPKCDDAGINDTWFSENIGNVKYVAEYIAGIQEFLLTNFSSFVSAKSRAENHKNITFELYQNYPNPFNPKTTIRYMIGTQNLVPQQVSLSIYNTLGQKIATLVDEKQSAGKYEVGWNASRLANGVYLYQLKIGDQIKTRKMILLK